MKLNTLTLNDFQSYDNETIDFDTGISVIYGENGAGKSTLLRGIFAALFQTSMKSELTGDINIGGLVNKHEQSGSVELTFEENGEEYTVFWEIEVTEEEDGERRGRTKSCNLQSADGELTLSGVTDVTDYITNLLGIDAQAFVNSVYVQQEELTKLLTADTDTRKQIFDRLLGLQQIDTYIDRIDDARREVKSVRKDKTSRKEELQNQLAEKPDPEELEQKQENISRKIDSLESDISELREERDELKSEKTNLENADENADELEAEQEELEQKVSEKRDEIGTLNEDLDSLKTEKQQVEDELGETIDASVDELQEELSDLRDERESLQSDQSEAQESFTDTQATLREKAAKLTRLTQDVYDAQSNREEAQVELEHIRTQLQQELDTKDALEAELAPLYGDIDTVADADSLIETLQERKSEVESDIANLTARIEDLRETEARERERLKQTNKQITEKKEELEIPTVFNNQSVTIDEIETRLLDAVSDTSDTDQLTAEDAYEIAIDILPEQQQAVAEDAISTNADELPQEYDDIEELRTLAIYYTELYEQQEVKKSIESLRENAQTIGEKLSSISSQLDDCETTKELYESDKDEIESKLTAARNLKNTLETVSELQEEFSTVSDTYETASENVTELKREQNTLNESLQDLFTTATEQKDTADELQDEIAEIDSQIQDKQDLVQEVQDQQQLETKKETLQAKIENKEDILEDKTEQLTDLKNNLEDVEAELADLDTSNRTVEEVEHEIESVEASITKKETTRNEKQAALATTKDTLETVTDLESQVSELESEIEALTDKLEEVKEVKQSYITVKETTRKKYLSKINQYTNEIFSTIYENESYESVEIDSDYRITLHTADGTEIEPSLTSGGESAIVNLALRAGVYRVITEAGNGSLPPFILDEPTTFLDTQHVGKLEALARKMADWDIKQVFIVSHNEQLIESGDAVYNVTKDANKSKVAREY